MKSLELLVPGGVEKLEVVLEQIAKGIHSFRVTAGEEQGELQVDESPNSNPEAEGGLHTFTTALRVDADEEERELQVNQSPDSNPRGEHILEVVGDPWLWAAYPTLDSDLGFALWGTRSWVGDEDPELDPLKEAIRSPPRKTGTEVVLGSSL